MTTRQELYTAIGLIRQTCRLNGYNTGLIAAMKYEGLYSNPEKINEPFVDFAAQKEYVRNLCDIMNKQSFAINTLLQKVDSKFLDDGINYISVVATRTGLVSDAQSISALTGAALPLIEAAISRDNLRTLSNSFENYVSECGIAEPNPWAIIKVEANYANILQDILDAMSHELQGKNSYTGQPHGQGVRAVKKLMARRIFTGWVYHSRLTQGNEDVGFPDKQKMGSVLSYIENGLGTANILIKLKILGQYIDTEIPNKLQIVRRWWAL